MSKNYFLRKPQAQKVLYEKFHAVESSSQCRKSFCQATTILIPKLDADGIQKGNCHGQRQRKTPKLHISKSISALSKIKCVSERFSTRVTGSLLIGTALTSPSTQPKDRKLTMSMDIQTWKPPHPIKIPS